MPGEGEGWGPFLQFFFMDLFTSLLQTVRVAETLWARPESDPELRREAAIDPIR